MTPTEMIAYLDTVLAPNEESEEKRLELLADITLKLYSIELTKDQIRNLLEEEIVTIDHKITPFKGTSIEEYRNTVQENVARAKSCANSHLAELIDAQLNSLHSNIIMFARQEQKSKNSVVCGIARDSVDIAREGIDAMIEELRRRADGFCHIAEPNTIKRILKALDTATEETKTLRQDFAKGTDCSGPSN